VNSRKKPQFADSAVISGLVTPDQIDRAVQELLRRDFVDTAQSLSDEAVASYLIATGALTPYQGEQLRAGRTKLTLGPYLITDWLGQGGMGQVFKATHQLMGREVAIKVLPQSKSTPEAIENFTREIRTQAQLDHSNLVRAFDAGRDGNVYFLVTEYVPGTDLRRLVRIGGRLSMSQAASVIAQVALGLDHAHQRGLIHRDIKPGNILVTPKGVAKLSDLGLAGFMSDEIPDPRAGKVVGTADYLAPEQVRNPTEVLAISDIYSLGCTLYYAVTGKVPFPGGRTREKVRRHLQETPWHPRRFSPDLNEEFVDIIADMMEKDVRRRVPTAAEVAARLDPWVGEQLALPTQGLGHSPWQAPPLPTGFHDTAAEGEDPDLSNEFSDSRDDSLSHGQISESTNPVAAVEQETRVVPRPRPLPVAQAVMPLRTRGRLATASIVLISMAAGAGLMWYWMHQRPLP